MKMQVQRVNVVAFTRKIMENFDSVAEEHHIDFFVRKRKSPNFICGWMSINMKKDYFQLALNAFKYTRMEK